MWVGALVEGATDAPKEDERMSAAVHLKTFPPLALVTRNVSNLNPTDRSSTACCVCILYHTMLWKWTLKEILSCAWYWDIRRGPWLPR